MPEIQADDRLLEEIDRLAGVPGSSPPRPGEEPSGQSPEAKDDPAIRAAAALAKVDWSDESRRRAELRARWITGTRAEKARPSFGQRAGAVLAWSGRAAAAILLLALIGISWKVLDQAARQGWNFAGTVPTSTAVRSADATPPVSMTVPATPLPGVLPVPRATSALVVEQLPGGASARLGKGQVQAMAISPDGSRLAVGSTAGVCLYAVPGYSETWCISTPDLVTRLAFNPGGDRLLAGTRGGYLLTWSAVSGAQQMAIRPNGHMIYGVAWAPDGARFTAVDGSGELILRDPKDGRPLETPFQDAAGLVALAWSPDGTRLAVAGQNGAIRLWDLAAARPISLDQTSRPASGAIPSALAWSGDGDTLALASGIRIRGSGAEAGELRFWDTRTGKLIRAVPFEAWVTNLSASPDGTHLASLQSDGTVGIWDARSGQSLDLSAGYQANSAALAWAGDGKTIFLLDSSGQVASWDLAASRVTRAIDGYTSPLVDLAWAPDGKTLAASYTSGQLVLWDAAAHKAVSAWKGDPTQPLLLAWDPLPGVELLAVGGDTVMLWNMATRNPVRELSGDLPRVSALAWSPKGWQVAAGGATGIVYVWEANTGQALRRIDVGHAVAGVAWSPDEQVLAVSWSEGGSGGIELYDGTSGKHLASLNSGANAGELAWSPDGSRLAALAGGWVMVWDAAGRRQLFNLGAGHSTGVISFAWSPDGRELATAGGEIFLWDVAARQKVKTFTGHTEDITALGFSPDGKTLVSGSSDGTVLLWDLAR